METVYSYIKFTIQVKSTYPLVSKYIQSRDGELVTYAFKDTSISAIWRLFKNNMKDEVTYFIIKPHTLTRTIMEESIPDQFNQLLQIVSLIMETSLPTKEEESRIIYDIRQIAYNWTKLIDEQIRYAKIFFKDNAIKDPSQHYLEKPYLKGDVSNQKGKMAIVDTEIPKPEGIMLI